MCWFPKISKNIHVVLTFARCSLKSNSLKSSFEIRIFANSLLKKVTINKSIEDVLTVDWFKNKIKITILPETNKNKMKQLYVL